MVEVRSQGDETYRELPFCAAVGVREVLVLHPGDRTAELFRAVDGELRPVSADTEGGLRCEVLGRPSGHGRGGAADHVAGGRGAV